jgi:SAM-dependent methyltransferase
VEICRSLRPFALTVGDVIDATLCCATCAKRFPVRGGIPRFLDGVPGYNASWNYKWNAIDRGRGLNHLILDKRDPAYELHDVYDRNSHGGRAFNRTKGGRALEIGCGVGQYVLKSLLEHSPRKIVALDLTEGVDTLRRIIIDRWPDLLERILFVQASVFSMPFRPSSFDYVYSLEFCTTPVAPKRRSGQLRGWCGKAES